MTKQEILKAIENGESVWFIFLNNVYEFKLKNHTNCFINKKGNEEIYNYTDENGSDRCFPIKALYKSQAEAEHYLHHANVERVEKLPFLTWEEFTSDIMAFNSFSFMSDEDFKCSLFYDKENDLIILDKGYETDTYGATEANFYKAYDECVRLFKGEEI